MKLLIIEGPDRCGKNTLINGICSVYDNHIVRHFGFPVGNDDMEKRNFQYHFFRNEFSMAQKRNETSSFCMNDDSGIYIWNRAHLGEMVYGQIYRNTHPGEWVMRMEKSFSFDLDPSIYLVLLEASPEFLVEHDDGHSFSEKIENKRKEIELFEGAFSMSLILNKMKMDVSMKNGSFKDKNEILKRVLNFIKK